MSSPTSSLPDIPPRIDSTRLILLEEGWNKIYNDGIVKLQTIIQEGVHKGFTNKEYMDLYTTIYQMCIQKAPHCYTPQLYERYEMAINEYLQSTALPAITNKSNEFLVKEFVRRWNDHKLMKQWLFDFFRYLDRFFVKRHGKKPLKEVAISRFRVLIFEQVKAKVVVALLDLIKRDRNGDEVDRDLLRDAIAIFVEMGMGTHKVYTMEFEKAFIKATSDYYGREAANWLASDSCPEYLRKAEGRFMEEKKRLEDYLHTSSETPLLETLNQCLLIQHQSSILEKENTGLRIMLKTHAENDLARLYQLYSGIPKHLQPIANIVQKHIEDIGNTLIDKVNAEQNAATYIEELMKIHQTYYDLVRTCFQGNTIFQRALKDAFEVIVNKATFQSSTAELLATFADNVLLKGGVKLTEKELETTLDNVVRLFTYLTDKDFFSEFYRKQLATRLLMQRSASTDAEKSMIGRLKLACGAQFTSKLEGMIMDMAQAHDHQGELKEFLVSNMVDLHGIDFTVQTLTTGFWPTYPMDEIKLPSEMNKCLDSFRVYYDKKTSNRRLRWIHDLGVVTLQANFTKGRRDLVVSTVQAAILMLFNEMEEYSIDELIKHTGLEADVMKQQLKSLVSGKFKILMKKPSEGYATNHRIRVNQAFVHAQLRIRIPNAVRRTTDKDRAGATAAVQEDRKHAIEAAIVRVMKARKTLNHQQLISEVSAQLMQFFQPDPRAIKKRIEDLIAREYLERDKEQSNMYHYLA